MTSPEVLLKIPHWPRPGRFHLQMFKRHESARSPCAATHAAAAGSALPLRCWTPVHALWRNVSMLAFSERIRRLGDGENKDKIYFMQNSELQGLMLRTFLNFQLQNQLRRNMNGSLQQDYQLNFAAIYCVLFLMPRTCLVEKPSRGSKSREQSPLQEGQ